MDFASRNLTAGQLNAIVKKLGGEKGALRFLRGELLVSAVKPIEMPVWKTVKLGLHKSPDEYRAALRSAKRKITDWANEILDDVTCSQEEKEVDLVLLSTDDLGLKDENWTKYRDICTKAIELGLEICSAEVGFALRLQYPDQPRGESVRMPVEAVTGWRDYGFICVSCGSNGRWVEGVRVDPDGFYKIYNPYCFVKPRI
jgi:hypothetical protein